MLIYVNVPTLRLVFDTLLRLGLVFKPPPHFANKPRHDNFLLASGVLFIQASF